MTGAGDNIGRGRAAGVGRAVIAACAGVLGVCASGAAAQDFVAGTLVQFNENGAWSWYQDERALVSNGQVLVSSIGSGAGLGGSGRDGNVDLVHYDIAMRRANRVLLADIQADDHNSAALLVRPDGRYLAVYGNHGTDNLTRYRISANPGDPSAWGAELTFNNGIGTTYSNVFHLSAEGRTYNFTRTNGYDPNFLVSSDQGSTWSYGGYLLRDPANNNSTRPYLKYTSNGTDRVYFIATEGHPRDVNNGIWAGYYQDGNTFRMNGTPVAPVGNNSTVSAPSVTSFTSVIAANTVVGGTTRTHFWTTDLALDASGNPYAAFTSRVAGSSNDHRFYYARWNGSAWAVNEVARAGGFLYAAENDYTGLVALDPENPDQLFVSTNIDPTTGASLARYEIYRGATADAGATWNWSAITRESSVNNLRPILTNRDDGSRALMWMRGTYTTYLNYDLSIVGLIDSPPTAPLGSDAPFPVQYIDAAPGNTARTTGTGAWTTAPAAGMGATDNLWHRRTGFGNGNEVFTADEPAGENAPALTTTVTVTPGLYDVYVYFWSDNDEAWQIRAGLSAASLMTYDVNGSQHVEVANLLGATVTDANANDLWLYQAYLGRQSVGADGLLQVFIDDGTGVLATRTWYDGIGYSRSIPVVPEPQGALMLLATGAALVRPRR